MLNMPRLLVGVLLLCVIGAAPAAASVRAARAAGASAPPLTAWRGTAWLVFHSGPSQSTSSAPSLAERMRVTGFLRTDVIFDTSRPDSLQSPLFIAPPAIGGVEGGHTFTIHPRLSRITVDLTSTEIGPATLSGRFEVDFQNGGRESRAVPRYRHVFIEARWRAVAVLAGQTWDVISPLHPGVNADTLMWNAGNLGDRRAQVRVTYERTLGSRFRSVISGGIALSGAVSGTDIDVDGLPDGEQSGRPQLQGRVALVQANGRPSLHLGFSAHRGWERWTGPDHVSLTTPSYSASLDFSVALAGAVMFRGELWTGTSVADVRGGIGQGVNTTYGRGIRSRGGWAELVGSMRRFRAGVGATRDDPREEDLPAQGRSLNQSFYGFLQVRFADRLIVGSDVLRWDTTHLAYGTSRDYRINPYVVLTF